RTRPGARCGGRASSAQEKVSGPFSGEKGPDAFSPALSLRSRFICYRVQKTAALRGMPLMTPAWNGEPVHDVRDGYQHSTDGTKGIWVRELSSVSDSAGLLTSIRRHCRYFANSRHSLGKFTSPVRGPCWRVGLWMTHAFRACNLVDRHGAGL